VTFQAIQEDVVVNCVEGGAQVKKEEYAGVTFVCSQEEVVGNREEERLDGVASPVGILVWR
jgi:hypothetical protein